MAGIARRYEHAYEYVNDSGGTRMNTDAQHAPPPATAPVPQDRPPRPPTAPPHAAPAPAPQPAPAA
ncbi:hypothetical protein, partial [Streptomyces sp.]|uniref:hypothetical protein n=1 Tax=Streptomyces sp. TaxID=1931 RepID=UPI002F924890